MTSTQTGKEGAVSAAVEALRKAMIAAARSALDKLAAAEPPARAGAPMGAGVPDPAAEPLRRGP